MSDIAWQRVERGLFKALDCDNTVAPEIVSRRRPWAPWALAGAFAAAAAVMVVILIGRGAPDQPRAGGANPPARVVTQDTPTEVSFGDAVVTVGAGSALTMRGDAAHGVLIVVERGSATFEVAPRVGRPPYVVSAGEVEVQVVGTRFTVTRHGDAARVEVADGVVEVVSRGERVHVRAGESWPVLAARTEDPPVAELAPEIEPEIEIEPVIEPARMTVPDRPRSKARATAPAVSDRGRFEHAAALEASDARAALKEYRALARGKSAWAANALYAAGRLAAELGDRSTAADLLEKYLERFPRGGNAADARSLLDSLGG